MIDPTKPVFSVKMDGFDRNFQAGFDNFLRIGEQSVNAKYDIAHRPQYKDHGHISEHYQKQFVARPFGSPVRHVQGSGLSNSFHANNTSTKMTRPAVNESKLKNSPIHLNVNETGSLRSTHEDGFSQLDGHHIDVDPLNLHLNADKLQESPRQQNTINM